MGLRVELNRKIRLDDYAGIVPEQQIAEVRRCVGVQLPLLDAEVRAGINLDQPRPVPRCQLHQVAVGGQHRRQSGGRRYPGPALCRLLAGRQHEGWRVAG